MSTSHPLPAANDRAVLEAIANLMNCTTPELTDFSQLWSSLSDEQFMAVMELVMAADPIRIAAAWTQVKQRLVSRGLLPLQKQLLREMTGRIKVIDLAMLTQLEQTPPDMSRTIVRSLDPLPAYSTSDERWWEQRVFAFELVIQTLYKLHKSARRYFLDEALGKFAAVHPFLLYRSVRLCINKYGTDDTGRISKWLEFQAIAWVRQAGYQLFTVKMRMHRDQLQPYVHYRTRRFVPQAGTYHPNEDEQVLFDPQGRILVNKPAHKVVAVAFIPVN